MQEETGDELLYSLEKATLAWRAVPGRPAEPSGWGLFTCIHHPTLHRFSPLPHFLQHFSTSVHLSLFLLLIVVRLNFLKLKRVSLSTSWYWDSNFSKAWLDTLWSGKSFLITADVEQMPVRGQRRLRYLVMCSLSWLSFCTQWPVPAWKGKTDGARTHLAPGLQDK